MSRNPAADTSAATVDMTPMLDIVFIMLIFFVVTATFIRESGLEVFAPDDGPPEPPVTTENIHVVIDDRDVFTVEGRAVDPRRLPATLTGLAASRSGPIVVIEPGPNSTVQSTVTAIDAALAAGLANYRLMRGR